jgi:hypothetical protein
MSGVGLSERWLQLSGAADPPNPRAGGRFC